MLKCNLNILKHMFTRPRTIIFMFILMFTSYYMFTLINKYTYIEELFVMIFTQPFIIFLLILPSMLFITFYSLDMIRNYPNVILRLEKKNRVNKSILLLSAISTLVMYLFFIIICIGYGVYSKRGFGIIGTDNKLFGLILLFLIRGYIIYYVFSILVLFIYLKFGKYVSILIGGLYIFNAYSNYEIDILSGQEFASIINMPKNILEYLFEMNCTTSVFYTSYLIIIITMLIIILIIQGIFKSRMEFD